MTKHFVTISERNFIRDPAESSAQIVLDDHEALQRTFLHLHRCGPATTALAVAAMLDRGNVSARLLDFLLGWTKVDPADCRFGFDCPAWEKPPHRGYLPGARLAAKGTNSFRLIPKEPPEQEAEPEPSA